MSIAFTVPSVPVAQPRQRQRVGYMNGKPMAMNYTPAKHPVNAFKAACQLAASEAYQGPPLTGPLRVSLVFVMPRPKLKPAWITRDSLWYSAWRDGSRFPCIVKPDRDNLEKGFADSLNELLWVDDRQIYSGPVEKWIASGDEQPHVEVIVSVI